MPRQLRCAVREDVAMACAAGGRPALLGIDLGTSFVKVVMLGIDGRPLASTSAPYPVRTPHPGWAESDPREWWDATVTATRAAVTASGDATPAALRLSRQLHN